MSEHTDEPAEPVEPDDWRPWEHYTGVDPLPDDHDAIRDEPCPYCGALPGEPCDTADPYVNGPREVSTDAAEAEGEA